MVIYSDTDSIIVRKSLEKKFIGGDIGLWKEESIFKDGVFVRKKLYCYTDLKNNTLIKKASGVDSNKLEYSDYVKLAKGKKIRTYKDKFNVDWIKLKIVVHNQAINLGDSSTS
jgi:hypothetical protein